MSDWKYHAVLDFGYNHEPIRFTAVDLEHLMKRFQTEVDKEVARRKELREYTWVEPNLTVEVCSSWAEFKQFDHVRGDRI